MQVETEEYVISDWQCHPIKAVLIWSITACFIISQFFLQLSIGVITKPLRETFLLDAFELSLLASAYYIIYLALQIPAGILIDRYGSKRVLSLGCVFAMTGCWLFSHTDSFVVAVVCRVMMGGGMAFSFIASLNVAAKWFPIKYLGLMTGVAESVAMFGAIVGNLVLASLVTTLSWRICFFYISGLLALLLVITLVFLKDSPVDPHSEQEKLVRFKDILSQLRWVLKFPSIWLIGIYAGLSYLPITVFGALWGIPFLMKGYALTNFHATCVSSLILFGLGVGAPVISSRFGSFHPQRILVMIAAPLVIACMLLLIIYVTTLPHLMLYFEALLLGFFSGILITSYGLAAEIVPAQIRNSSIGVVNTLALITAPTLQSVIGYVLEKQSDVMSPKDIELYSVADYQYSLAILPALLLVATVIAMLINPNPIEESAPKMQPTPQV